MAGRRERAGRAAARTRHGVQVDVVRHLVVLVVLEIELDGVTLAHANELAGHGAAEGPERVANALGDLHLDLAHLEVDADLGRSLAPGWLRHERRRRELRDGRNAYGRTEVTLGGAAGVVAFLR